MPPAINISKECETAPMRMSFPFPQKPEFRSILMHSRKLHKFIILTIIMLGSARFSHSGENVLANSPCSMIYAPASDRMEIVQGAAGNLDGDCKSLGSNTTSR